MDLDKIITPVHCLETPNPKAHYQRGTLNNLFKVRNLQKKGLRSTGEGSAQSGEDPATNEDYGATASEG